MSAFDLTTKKFVAPPCSRCDCPAGLGGCSHLCAKYAILAAIKDVVKDCSMLEEVVMMFPPALSTMKGYPIPWDLITEKEFVVV